MAGSHSILTINGGSSSIKFAAFADDGSLTRSLDGKIVGIGLPEGHFRCRGTGVPETLSHSVAVPTHEAAVDLLMDFFAEQLAPADLLAVGHRVVHGGPKYRRHQPITPEMLQDLHRLSPFDPEHLPQELLLMESFARRFPGVPQVACFDTAFHQTLPPVARLLPIPRRRPDG